MQNIIMSMQKVVVDNFVHQQYISPTNPTQNAKRMYCFVMKKISRKKHGRSTGSKGPKGNIRNTVQQGMNQPQQLKMPKMRSRKKLACEAKCNPRASQAYCMSKTTTQEEVTNIRKAQRKTGRAVRYLIASFTKYLFKKVQLPFPGIETTIK